MKLCDPRRIEYTVLNLQTGTKLFERLCELGKRHPPRRCRLFLNPFSSDDTRETLVLVSIVAAMGDPASIVAVSAGLHVVVGFCVGDIWCGFQQKVVEGPNFDFKFLNQCLRNVPLSVFDDTSRRNFLPPDFSCWEWQMLNATSQILSCHHHR